MRNWYLYFLIIALYLLDLFTITILQFSAVSLQIFQFLINSPFIFGFVIVSSVLGMFCAYWAYVFVVWITGSSMDEVIKGREGKLDWRYQGFWTGVFERCFFTFGIGMLGTPGSSAGGGVLSAMITWIAVKGQVHYKIFSDPTRTDMRPVYQGLLGSLASLLFAILGGAAWNSCVSVKTLFDIFRRWWQ